MPETATATFPSGLRRKICFTNNGNNPPEEDSFYRMPTGRGCRGAADASRENKPYPEVVGTPHKKSEPLIEVRLGEPSTVSGSRIYRSLDLKRKAPHRGDQGAVSKAMIRVNIGFEAGRLACMIDTPSSAVPTSITEIVPSGFPVTPSEL